MSIKIWQAWKIPSNKLNEALKYLGDRVVEEYIYPKYKKLIEAALKDVAVNKPEKSDIERFLDADTIVDKLIQESSLKHYNCMSNLDCSVGVSLQGRFCYLTPFGFYLDNNTLPDYFADFHYQNQTNSKLSKKEQRKRAKKWDELFNLPELQYVIFKGTSLYRSSDLSRKYYQEEYIKETTHEL